MVFYFTSAEVSPPYVIYVGEDKHENEELIRWGWPEDVWFHVDKLSSAHVYLRLHQNETVDDIPESVLADCAQLVKANSIQGSKQNELDVVYTPWANLKKTAEMDVGQVGFFNQKQVRTIHVQKRINEIVNRLNKTKEEKKPDFRALREERDQKERERKKAAARDEKQVTKEMEEKKKQDAELRSYTSLMDPDKMTSNLETGYDSDEFM